MCFTHCNRLTRQPTIFAHHTPSPGTVMIHPQHTAIQFAAVVSTIRFPITAFGAPLGTAIGFADEYIFCVELFESGTVGIGVWCYKVRLALEVVSAMFVAPIFAAPP